VFLPQRDELRLSTSLQLATTTRTQPLRSRINSIIKHRISGHTSDVTIVCNEFKLLTSKSSTAMEFRNWQRRTATELPFRPFSSSCSDSDLLSNINRINYISILSRSAQSGPSSVQLQRRSVDQPVLDSADVPNVAFSFWSRNSEANRL